MNAIVALEKHPNVSLWQDAKFRWLVASVIVVALFEFLSLAGWHLPDVYAAPFFFAIILIIGYRTLWNGVKALVKLNFKSINLLMVVAVVGAFYLGEYEEAAVVIVLFTLGERLERIGIERNKSALQALIERTPKTATVKGKSIGEEQELPVEHISIGDTLIIKPSAMIAMDAEVTAGTSSIDESTITGEPLPKDNVSST